MLWRRLLLRAGQMSVKTSWVRVLLGPGFLRPLFSPDAGWSGCPVEVSACCNQLSYRLSYHGARHTQGRLWFEQNMGGSEQGPRAGQRARACSQARGSDAF